MKLFRNYGLSIALFSLFALSWLGQLFFQWFHFISEQQAHRQPVKIDEFFNAFMSSTLENWQSEFLQLFSFVVLATYLIHKGSPQSKDSDEEVKRILKDIQKNVTKKTK